LGELFLIEKFINDNKSIIYYTKFMPDFIPTRGGRVMGDLDKSSRQIQDSATTPSQAEQKANSDRITREAKIERRKALVIPIAFGAKGIVDRKTLLEFLERNFDTPKEGHNPKVINAIEGLMKLKTIINSNKKSVEENLELLNGYVDNISNGNVLSAQEQEFLFIRLFEITKAKK
jgi:hypothetical protein